MGLSNLAILLLTIITGISIACNHHDESQGHQEVGHVYVRVSSQEMAKSIIANIAANQDRTVANGAAGYCSRKNEKVYKMLTKWCTFDNYTVGEKYLVFI